MRSILAFVTLGSSLLKATVLFLVLESTFSKWSNGNDRIDGFSISKSVSYSGGIGSVVNVELGVVQAGGKGIVDIDIKNSSSRPFKVNKISVGCSCISAKCYGDNIEEDGSVHLSVEMAVPTRASAAKQSQFIKIEQSESEVIQLSLNYELAGVGCFKVNSISVNAPKSTEMVEFSVPILIAAPTSPDKLKIFGTGDLANLQASVVESNDGYSLKCTLPVSRSGDLALAGELFLKDISTGVENSISCYVDREGEVVVSPRVIHFSKRGDHWEAIAIVRSNNAVNNSQRELSIAGKVDNTNGSLVVESNAVRPGLFRVKLKLSHGPSDASSPIQFPKKIDWQIGWDGGIAEPSTKVAF